MHGLIAEERILEVRQTASIVDIVSEYVALTKRGRNLLGLCPFHAEKTPSFTVSPDKQIFHCFGCGQGGNVFSFVMRYHNFSFPEAVRFVARKYGIEIATASLPPEQKKRLDERDRILALNREAADFFRHLLTQSSSGKPGRDYLLKRGIPPEVNERFFLGYCPKEWGRLTQYFAGKGISLPAVEKSGLVVAKKDGRGYYDRFRGRIIFPIADVHGRIVGFGGRSLDDDLPKYLNSPETPVYHKGRILYGLDAAKDNCRSAGEVVVVEGYFDALSLHAHGVANAVATLGTALTRDHIRILKGYAERVLLVFDSDEAGLKAAERSLPLFAEEQAEARIMVLPGAKDPDEFVSAAGGDGFRKACEKAQGVMGFLMSTAIDRYGLSPEGKIRIVEALRGPLVSLVSGVTRSIYVRGLAERLNIDEAALLAQVRSAAPEAKGVQAAAERIRGPRLEEAFLTILLKYPDIVPLAEAEELVAAVSDAQLRCIGEMVLERIKTDETVAGADLIAAAEESPAKGLISSLMFADVSEDRDGCLRIVAQYKERHRKQQDRMMRARIKEAEKARDDRLVSKLLAEKQRRTQARLEG